MTVTRTLCYKQVVNQPISASPHGESPWPRRLKWAAAGLVVLFLGSWAGAAFIPRWWAQTIGDQVEGSFTAGITLGLVYGFVFTLLSLLVLLVAVRKLRSWKVWLAYAALAVLLALPNLFTLGIVVGTGDGAHAGDRILDVEAPGFRWATFFGALVAVLLVLAIQLLVISRERAQDETERLRSRDTETV